MSKYAEGLTKTKAENDAALAPARAGEQQAALALAISKKQVTVRGYENELATLESAYPLDLSEIVEANNALEWINREIAQLQSLSTKLFS